MTTPSRIPDDCERFSEPAVQHGSHTAWRYGYRWQTGGQSHWLCDVLNREPTEGDFYRLRRHYDEARCRV